MKNPACFPLRLVQDNSFTSPSFSSQRVRLDTKDLMVMPAETVAV